MNTIVTANEPVKVPHSGIISFDNAVSLGRIGSLETRLANTEGEIRAAQKLRYKVFVEELGAHLPKKAMAAQLDYDDFDTSCDHLLVIDHDILGSVEDKIVGTYRIMKQQVAEKTGGFYSQGEFDVAALVNRHRGKSFVELGRSCVLPTYRTRRSVELLWQGIWSYVRKSNIDVMFGCASFHGTVPAAHALALSFLHHNARADESWSVKAHEEFSHTMDLMPIEAISPRIALTKMPPLIKGYLRVGAKVAQHAVIDHAFNTTDVLIVLPKNQINARYINHYGADATRFAA